MRRRRFLRGLGVALALPPLESIRSVWARTAAASGPAVTSTGAPLRLAFVYVPNGVIQPTWWPAGDGQGLALSPTLRPLDRVKHLVQILGGLDHVTATPGADGAGDHARASGSFLTGVRVKKTAGADVRAAVSMDQVAASQIGSLTRFPSLELTCDAVRKSGSCDSGYSCSYQYNLSWRSATTPLAPEPNPRLLFERLFGAGPHGQRHASLQRRREQQRSVLDFVLEDARTMEGDLSKRDQQKLGEYYACVRDIERRIANAERLGEAPDPEVATPDGIPADFGEYLDLMFDLLALAFQTDSTRVATFLLAHEGSNRAFPELDIPEGHHSLSHHQNKREMIDKVAAIDRFYVSRFARFLETMEHTPDVDGRSLLANSMIVYGSGNADGNQHTHVNLPVLLAGGGGGALTPGRFVKLPATPMCNLFLSLGDRLGLVGVDRHGDSTGRVTGI